jgi:arylsulfatase A-like enzyme
LRGNKYSSFEGGTHIPFIVRWPGHVSHGTSAALVSQIDLIGSFAHFLGAVIPQGNATDSRNAWEAWTGKDPTGRDYVVEEAADHTLSLRTHEWKYIQPSDTPVPLMKAENVETGYLPTPQLYKIDKDIHEDENVATSYPDTLFKLQSLLRRIKNNK